MWMWHCYLSPLGIMATVFPTAYIVYYLVKCFIATKRSVSVQADVERVTFYRRTDLPESDLQGLRRVTPMYGRIEAIARYKYKDKEYKTNWITYWDMIGLKSVSEKLGFYLLKKKEDGENINVLVDPKDPSRAVMFASLMGTGAFEAVVILVAFIVVGFTLEHCLSEMSAVEVLATGAAGAALGMGLVWDAIRRSKEVAA